MIKSAICLVSGLLIAFDAMAVELKCTIEWSFLLTESSRVPMPERRGATYLYVLALAPPASLIIQPVLPSGGAPYQLACSSSGEYLKCRGNDTEVTIAFVPGKTTNVVSEKRVQEIQGRLSDALTCRFLQPGENALD